MSESNVHHYHIMIKAFWFCGFVRVCCYRLDLRDNQIILLGAKVVLISIAAA